jgi:hypothetical protein
VDLAQADPGTGEEEVVYPDKYYREIPTFQWDEVFGDSDVTDEQKRIMDDAFAPLEVRETKKSLHWYQWVVYTVVLVTCLAVLVGMLETYLMVQAIQDAAERFATGLEN